jgi:hypothetical protein
MYGAPIERVVRLAVVPACCVDPDLDFLGPSSADAIGMCRRNPLPGGALTDGGVSIRRPARTWPRWRALD